MRAATLESRLEELGVLRSFSRTRVSNDNPYSESLFHSVYMQSRGAVNAGRTTPRRPFLSGDD
jgi:transposase InsO family protein